MNPNGNGSFSSRLQPPTTRVPDVNRLAALPESEQNVRQKLMGPPPAVNGVKRKTLAEQAGETGRPAPQPPGSRVPNGNTRSGTLASLSRQHSYSSSASSRPTSASSYRNASNSSTFSQSAGGGRPPSSQSSRPHTTMSSYSSGSKSGIPGHRPQSSLDYGRVGRNTSTEGTNGNSMRNFSSSFRKISASRKNKEAQQESDDSQNERLAPWLSSLDKVTMRKHSGKSIRDISISTQMKGLTLHDPDVPQDRDQIQEEQEEETMKVERICNAPKTPSHLPRKKPSVQFTPAPDLTSPTKSSRKTPKPIGGFLSKSSNVQVAGWDVNDRIERVESLYSEMKGQLEAANGERDKDKDTMASLKTRYTELDGENAQLRRVNADLQREMDEVKSAKSSAILALEEFTRKQTLEASSLKLELDDQRRAHSIELDDLARQRRRELEDVRRDAEDDLRNRDKVHREEIAEMKRRLEDALNEEKDQRRKELNALSSEGLMAQQRAEVQLTFKEKELQALEEELEQSKSQTGRGDDMNRDLKAKLSEATTNIIALESSLRSSKARVDFLESDSKSQSQAFADLEQRTQDAVRESEEAKAKLRTEETLRRKLHNQVQELKGNIRVFCRVRPTLESDAVDNAARIEFPDAADDSKEVDVLGPEEKSSLGTITTKKNAFSFDRVFTPPSQNAEVFDEISQLVQSALDGYNVCIFCYGQTGSGKTFTMSSPDGMIPRAVQQIYETAQSLEEKGWRYSMEGSFVEIYNENVNDLLGKAEDFDKKKHEIRHDTQRCKTTITDVNTIMLDSPDKVHAVLKRAMGNRSVAATKANERSSRSHSVFILKLLGENHITGEKSEGTLNLVDLAGSERLAHSGATGERLKETQNINKSLSCLGDVIAALGQGKEGGHVPYRNSKLTYLLQYSLGGNSKTLMFVMISPLQAHLAETLTSLKFATKVHNTHIGTAKRQARIKD